MRNKFIIFVGVVTLILLSMNHDENIISIDTLMQIVQSKNKSSIIFVVGSDKSKLLPLSNFVKSCSELSQIQNKNSKILIVLQDFNDNELNRCKNINENFLFVSGGLSMWERRGLPIVTEENATSFIGACEIKLSKTLLDNERTCL
jgi:hypothetical protein